MQCSGWRRRETCLKMHDNMIQIINGDCLEKMRELPENSVDSIVTDPPYELGFMGKSWDNTGIANSKEMWREAMRVLKPGGHLLAFSGTRTYHRMASAIEDAGFEVRDMIEWVYGSGFPKSLNIGKAVDKLQGNEREETHKETKADSTYHTQNVGETITGTSTYSVTKGTSEWEGWGTALKPAHEPICMARKPLAEKTVAENCLKWGTGGINIDESRVEGEPTPINKLENWSGFGQEKRPDYVQEINTQGRFPANLIHDNSEEVRECFPDSKGGAFPKTHGSSGFVSPEEKESRLEMNDSGNASRFFKSIIYQAKASKSERNKGCEGLEETYKKRIWAQSELSKTDFGNQANKHPTTNSHPTVKPIALMSYLIKMVTPKGGTVLDPFMGTGSTGVAAKENGFSFIGIDMTPEYVEIASKRIESVV